MRNEQQSEIFHDALNLLDDEMIEEVDKLRTRRKKVKKFPWQKFTVVAASVCLLVIGGLAWDNYLQSVQPNSSMTENADVPENKLPTEEIGKDGLGEIENHPETEEMGKTNNIMPAVVGDLYQLENNYVSVAMLPNKAWEAASCEAEALAQAVPISQKYMEDMDKLVGVMCSADTVLTEELPESDPDLIYHLFFTRTDGTVIHCWLLEDGYIYYHDKAQVCLVIDHEVYETILNILLRHWQEGAEI